jgi:hypothetical protein
MAGFTTAVQVPIEEGPDWLSHFEFSREGDEIVIQAVNKKGFSYAESRMADGEFNKMADVILTRSSMEKML